MEPVISVYPASIVKCRIYEKKCRCQIQREHQKSVRLRKECGVAGSDWLSAGPVIWFNDAPTAYFAAMMDPKLTAAPTHVWCVQTGPGPSIK